MSRQLDFDVRINNQRPSRRPNAGPHIDVTDQKKATMVMHAENVWFAEQWGYRRAPTRMNKLEIAEMASRVVFYDMGCPKPSKESRVVDWITQLDNARFSNNTNFAQALKNEQLRPRQKREGSKTGETPSLTEDRMQERVE